MSSRTKHAILPLGLLLCAAPLAAQSMALKTLPLPTGEQFLVFPSRSLGMGSLSVAYDDPLADPFMNPARGAGLEGAWLVASPTTYDDSQSVVGGTTMPLAFTFGGERWFGTTSVAIQEVQLSASQGWWLRWPAALPPAAQGLITDDAATNSYLSASLGRKLAGGRWAVGLSGSLAELEGVDGVGQLYGNSSTIEQSGTISEVRLGVLHELGGERRVEGMIGRGEVDMEHDVVYFDWLPFTPTLPAGPTVNVRTEENQDHTITWSGSVRYTSPAWSPGTRFGLLLIGNTKSHPHIPNYEVVNIPRDPGNTTSFGLGAGVTSQQGGTTWGGELMIQPGRSHTWAYADSAIAAPAGPISKGDKTVDNRFRFFNWSLGLGMEHEWAAAGVQGGLRVHRYGYRLDQENYLRGTSPESDEAWIEWSPSWGAHVRLGHVQLRYTGRFVARGFNFREDRLLMPQAEPGSGSGVDFLVAPTDPVDMPNFRVVTHRLVAVLPLGGQR